MEFLPSLNSVSENKYFKRSGLYDSFRKQPLGFIDIGGAGGVHPNVSAFASLTRCTCFEPDKKAYQEIEKQYERFNPFSGMTIFNVALSKKAGQRKLYITKSPVNTSLLKPEEELVKRYDVKGFRRLRTATVMTESLDKIVFENRKVMCRPGEFIKIDCQGAEYEILQGAKKTIDTNCVALLLEVEFFKIYKGQRLFSEVDLYLRKGGFQLYGMYPHYISAKKIDRQRCDTEERIIWADVLYFKDPVKKNRNLNRNVESLIITAILNHYYDFAMELAGRYLKKADCGNIKRLILNLAERRKETIDKDFRTLVNECRRTPGKRYLLAKRFIDRHKSNNSVDFLYE